MTEAMVGAWFMAFISTILIEGPIYALFARGIWRVPKALAMSVILQLTTHPLLWLIFYDIQALIPDYVLAVLIAELGVVSIEAALLSWMWGRGFFGLALTAALTANAVSTAVGLLR